MKKNLITFALAFILNWLWENWHSQFYLYFKHGPITQGILFYAAIIDALIIVLVIALTNKIKRPWQQILFLVSSCLIVSIGLEWRALLTDRWAYAPAMPIIPVIETGLTPTIQLASTGLVVFLLTHKGRFKRAKA